ncbi:tRNA lysidine(34) synthetase TilS [Notoacmeibacter ruber]|uniref:tRNA(Ile)-lysidine synthase n=1 Tax=Notoacmeibacter ruber TaxID=2670375 RepID=A0A3L7JDC4_9HYPH|nr:tRNA lysidine(34) synthetase TilS [Notoacmeibacter ruber]RLQ88676.1 tRNA lysidine(34) synthetase TilS [Notoacmeibacter ruber]
MLSARQAVCETDGAPDFPGAPFSLPLPKEGPIVLAVSGGSDSVSMLHLVWRSLVRRGECDRLHVATVDHALRTGSAEEARLVGRICERLDLPHQVLIWSGEKPKSGIQAAAREARYRLLSAFAAPMNATILVAHTADDQAETLAMRQSRNPAPTLGLSGMASGTFWRTGRGGAWVMRPMLALRRAALREWLSKQGISYVDDPSNEDRRFERVRLRQDGSASIDGGGAGSASETSRDVIARRVAGILSSNAQRVDPSTLLLRWDDRFSMPNLERVEALRVMLAFAGGLDHRPATAAVCSLLKRLPQTRRSSLARCVVERRGDGLFIRREHRRGQIGKDDGSTQTTPLGQMPYPFAKAVPLHDLPVAQQVETLCDWPLTPPPVETFVHDIGK